MRRLLTLPLIIFALILGLSSCDKNSTNTPNNVASNYTRTTITGIVFNENHIPIEGAKVESYGRVKYTDPNGIFIFKDIYVPLRRFFVSINHNNHFKVMRAGKPVNNGITRIDAHLISHNGPNSQFDAFPSTSAPVVTLSDGSTIDFTTASFVDANGATYSGQVTLHTAALDAMSEEYSRRAPAGDQMGLDSGDEVLLDTRTGLMVELSDGNGNPLNIGNNTTATISASIPAGFTEPSGGSIPVFYASANNANNNREGSAVENGGKYEHQVGHFSYWSTQYASADYGTINCRVIDASGEILSGVRVQVGNAYGITGINGSFILRVPTGINIPVAIRSLDFYGLADVVKNEPALTNGEIRFVELQVPDIDRVVGKLVDCNSQPVEGYVALRWGDYISNTSTINGDFELPVAFTAGDDYKLYVSSNYKDTIINVSLSDGTTDLGLLSLCDYVSHVGSASNNTLQIDVENTGDIQNYSDYDVARGYHSDMSTPVTIIEVSGNDGSFQIYVDGQATTGTFTIGNGASVHIVTPTYDLNSGTVIITEYGPIGGVIKGTFSGVATDNSLIDIVFEVERVDDPDR